MLGTGKRSSKTAQSDTSPLPSLRQRDLQLPSRSQSCPAASVLTGGRAGRGGRGKRFKQQWLPDQAARGGRWPHHVSPTHTPALPVAPTARAGEGEQRSAADPLPRWVCACRGRAEIPLRLLQGTLQGQGQVNKQRVLCWVEPPHGRGARAEGSDMPRGHTMRQGQAGKASRVACPPVQGSTLQSALLLYCSVLSPLQHTGVKDRKQTHKSL